MIIHFNKKMLGKVLVGFVASAFFIIFVLFILIKTNVITGKATITWNENKESNLAGYRIYYGTSPRKGNKPEDSAYTEKVDSKMAHSYKFQKLSLFKTYYFSTTAYNKAGMESGLSAEVSKKIGIKDIFK